MSTLPAGTDNSVPRTQATGQIHPPNPSESPFHAPGGPRCQRYWRAPTVPVRPVVAGWRHGEPAGERDEPVPAAACRQPGRLVAVVGGGVRGGAAPGRAGAALSGLRGLPL